MKPDIATDLPVIEVPLELRGWSDEEIIRNSEMAGPRSYRNRPSKKERAQMKMSREIAKMREIAAKLGAKPQDSEQPQAAPVAPRRVLKSSFCGKMGFSFKARPL